MNSEFKIQKAKSARQAAWRVVLCLHFAFCIWHFTAAAAAAQQPPPTVTEIRLEQEGMVVNDPTLTQLIDAKVGQPLSMAAVRESITHLISLNRYDDVEVFQDPVTGGVRLRFVLFPLHPVDRVEFRGKLGLPEGELRKAVRDRYGAAPAAGRQDDVVALLKTTYRDRGYPQAMVTPSIEETHNPDRATMVMTIDSGPRASIAKVNIEQVSGTEQGTAALIQVRAGQPFDAPQIEKDLQKWVAAVKARGFYEARANHTETFDSAGATVTITLDRGPRVDVAFTGDPLPENERDKLVPIKAEGSADEDLLEDATRRIEDYLHARGYRDAHADYTRQEGEGVLTITFNVARGPRHTVADVKIEGNSAIATSELQPAIHVKSGDAYVQANVDATAGAIRNIYLARGFTKVKVTPTSAMLPPSVPDSPDRRDAVTITIAEGPRTVIRAITFRGNMARTDAQLRQTLTIAPGQPFSQLPVASDRDRLELDYRNRGYENASVDPDVTMAAGDTQADIRFTVMEGPQAIVDHIIIVGNERTSAKIIQRELLLKPNEPLGYSALVESQQRLSALGLFSRVRIDELSHGGQARRDVLVQVEEAPPTTLSYGGGIEAGSILRTSETGQAEEHVEFVPRAFVEIGRRNMWGKNRSVDLFTRAALRSQDLVVSNNGVTLTPVGTSEGFNEYRVYGTYREPKILNTRGDLLVTGIVDQAIRSSFNFQTRAVRAEVGGRVSSRYSVAGRYSIERTQLFDQHFAPEEEPLIDRLFPQVRLSKFSGSLIRDTRDDGLDPSTGHLVLVDSTVAARAYGSEVGFFKTYLQGFSYTQLPAKRRTIVALGARVGAAHGFPRDTPDGVVQDLPISERFFAGGDTTVRGFTLDRLGDSRTITPAGFPLGGNAVVILNGELRTAIFGQLQGHVFIDAGNVYPLATDIDLREIRGAAGFGFLYKTPVGPIRLDLGFKLDRRELVPGQLESRMAFNVSLGQAF